MLGHTGSRACLSAQILLGQHRCPKPWVGFEAGLTTHSTGFAGQGPLTGSTCPPLPAGPAPLPTNAYEAGEPTHPQLCALRAGLCIAAPGQEAAALTVRDLGCARVGPPHVPSLGGVFLQMDALPFLLGWEDIATAQSHGLGLGLKPSGSWH